MRLVVKQKEQVIHEFQFAAGPVHIGRHADSQIFLPDRTVSRHHAVIFSTQDGKWMVEDLDSVNKTRLNGKSVRKAEIKTSDILRIADFDIEINLEDDTIVDKPINLEDTLTKTTYDMEDTFAHDPLEPQVITRMLHSENAPDIKIPALRIDAFLEASEQICKADTLDEVLITLLDVTAKQFNTFRIWCALRSQPSGAMLCNAGKKRDGTRIQIEDLRFGEKINQAVEKKKYLLLPRIPPKRKSEKIHSAMIAPIISQSGCLGVLYADNDMSHEHYTLSDLDYMILLTIHTAVVLENF